MDTTFIYALVDPRCGEIFYVGKANVPQRRLKHHLYSTQRKANAAFRERLEAIKTGNLKVLMIILEECDLFGWEDRERYWITQLRNEGAALLNLNKGGNSGPEGSIRSHPDSVRILLRAKTKEQFSDPERRRRHREGVKRWVENITEEMREKFRQGGRMAVAHATRAAKQRWDSLSEEEKRQHQAKAHAWQKNVPDEYRKKMSTIKKAVGAQISESLRDIWERRRAGLIPPRKPRRRKA